MSLFVESPRSTEVTSLYFRVGGTQMFSSVFLFADLSHLLLSTTLSSGVSLFVSVTLPVKIRTQSFLDCHIHCELTRKPLPVH